MPTLINLTDEAKAVLRAMSIIEDFDGLDTAKWNTLQADAGATVAETAGANGLITLTLASDNEEAALFSNEILLHELDKPQLIVSRFQYAEADTNKANVFFGCMNAIGANSLLDNGGGPKATFDGAGFYKIDGETSWHFITSDGTTKIDKILDVTAGGTGFVTFAILLEPNEAGKVQATPLIDVAGGNALIQVAESGASPRAPLVKHDATFTTPTEMAAGIITKQGGATAQLLVVDLLNVHRLR